MVGMIIVIHDINAAGDGLTGALGQLILVGMPARSCNFGNSKD